MSIPVEGVVQRLSSGSGFVRNPARSFQPSDDDVFISSRMWRDAALVDGATIQGEATPSKKSPKLDTIDTICNMTPDDYRARTKFTDLVAVDPYQRFKLDILGDPSMRVIDLLAPIGRGTRGLVVAPPKAGKTQILEQMAHAIRADVPEARVIALLIDERPEEVTHFRRSVDAEVFASSNDQAIKQHTSLAELTLAHIRCELECGREVVVLVDSITRMTRAFNLKGAGSRRTMSGGIDAAALEIPRRFFGLARKIENGGSVTVIATALIDTGSRMDDYIFEEFKSTGNSEIVLDRELAEARIFPAINVLASGTRKEELLYSDDDIRRLGKLRRWLAKGTPKAAIRGLLKLIEQTENNQELLARINP